MLITDLWLWLGLMLVALLAFIYPYVIYPLVLRCLPRKPYLPDLDVDVSGTRVALLFCAYNEEAVLEEKIANVRHLKQNLPGLEVLAYSDASNDRTNLMLEQASDCLTPVISQVRTGKVLGMQKLVKMTDADVVVFSDANVIIEPAQLKRLLQYFENPEIGSVAATVHYLAPKDGFSATARVGGLYWKLEELIKLLESETGSTMGNHGALFARRRENYPNLPAHLVDDLGTSISVMFDGLRCLSAPDVIAYERLVASSADEYRRKRRIACGAFSTYQFLKPQLVGLSALDRFKFFSHKTLRWWGAVPLALAVCFAVMSGAASGYLFATLAGLASVALFFWYFGSIGVPGISGVYEIIRAVWGTWMGLQDAVLGRTYRTWSPAKSR